jgi:tellurite resistance protein
LKRRECFGLIVNEIKEAEKECKGISAEIDKLREVIDNPRKYAPEYIDQARSELYKLTRALDDVSYNRMQNVRAITDQMCATLDAEMELRGADIDEGDAKLLNYRLTEHEYIELLNRHGGNVTMEKLILKSAKEHGVDLPLTFVGNDAEKEQLSQLEAAAKVAMRHYGNEEVFDRLFGPNSAARRLWDADDRERPGKRETVKLSDSRVANAVRMLTDSHELADSVQADIIREFADHPGVLAVLRDAANRGGKAEAVATIEEVTGDKRAADFTRRAAAIRKTIPVFGSDSTGTETN